MSDTLKQLLNKLSADILHSFVEFGVSIEAELRRVEGSKYELTPAERQMAMASKIDAIKAVRARTGLPLKESKDLVDAYTGRTTIF